MKLTLTCRRRLPSAVQKIAIRPATHAALKAIARRSRRTLGDVVDQLLRYALAHHD